MYPLWGISSVFNSYFILIVATNRTIQVLRGFFCYMPIEPIRLIRAFFLELFDPVILDFFIQCKYTLIFHFMMLDFLQMALLSIKCFKPDLKLVFNPFLVRADLWHVHNTF